MTEKETTTTADAISLSLKERHMQYKEKGQGRMVRYRLRVSPELDSAFWTWMPTEYADGTLRGIAVVIDGGLDSWAIEQVGP